MISKKFVSLFQQSKLSLFSSRKYFFSNINREHGHEKPLEVNFFKKFIKKILFF